MHTYILLKGKEGLCGFGGVGAHLCPLSVGLYHEHDTGVWLIQRVSVQQSLAGHTQLYFGDAGSRAAEAGRRGGGLLNVIHPGSEREELPTSGAVQREACPCGSEGAVASAATAWGISVKTWRDHRGQVLSIWHRERKRFLLSPMRPNQTQGVRAACQSYSLPLLKEECYLTLVIKRGRTWRWLLLGVWIRFLERFVNLSQKFPQNMLYIYIYKELILSLGSNIHITNHEVTDSIRLINIYPLLPSLLLMMALHVKIAD